MVACNDLYGGAYRIFTKLYAKFGVEFTFVDATVTVNAEVHVDRLNLHSTGTVDGPGNLIVMDHFFWDGPMNGPGKTTIRGSSFIDQSAVLDGRTLENEGTMLLDGSLGVRNNAVINNRGEFLITSLGRTNRSISGDGPVAFNNFGTFLKRNSPELIAIPPA